MKKKKSDLTEQEYMETIDMLYTAAGSIKDRNSAKAFLRDLLTPSERIMLGRRIWIARLLLSGYSQAEIGEKLQVGPNTIWKVERWLRDQMPGYETVIKELEKELKHRNNRKPLSTFTFKKLKQKFPLHFLLFPKK